MRSSSDGRRLILFSFRDFPLVARIHLLSSFQPTAAVVVVAVGALGVVITLDVVVGSLDVVAVVTLDVIFTHGVIVTLNFVVTDAAVYIADVAIVIVLSINADCVVALSVWSNSRRLCSSRDYDIVHVKLNLLLFLCC